MRIRKLLLFLSFVFVLSSCDIKNDPFISVMQNANLNTQSEEIEDYVRHTTSEEILYLLENDESFIFYLSLKNCAGCILFKPNLMKYVRQTKALIYYLNVGDEDDYNAYADIWYEHQDMFKVPLEVPYLLFIKDKLTFKKGSVSKMTSNDYQTYEKMMNQLVKVNNLLSYQTLSTLENHFTKGDYALYIFYNREEENDRLFYKDYVYPSLIHETKNVEIIDYFSFNEDDQIDFLIYFSLLEVPKLSGYIVESQIILNSFTFTENVSENETFLNLYFNF